MRLSKDERAERREAFAAMKLVDKLDYLWAYYRLPIVLVLVVAVALGWMGMRALTHKEPLLYIAYANVALGEDFEQGLEQDFIAARGADAHRYELYAYRDMYLSNQAASQDHQYAYASKLKLMAAIDARQVDVVLMNEEAYDLLSGSGYLLDVGDVLQASAEGAVLEPLLVTNRVIVADNAVEYELGEAADYEAEFVEQANALRVSEARALASADLSDDVYLGFIANSAHIAEAVAFAAWFVAA